MRSSRKIETGVPYHIFQRGNAKRRIFSWAWEYRYFLKLMAEAKAEYGVLIHAIALMINHFHLLATALEDGAMSGFMQSFEQRYAQTRNLIRGQTGKLFEERFKSKPVRTDEYLSVVTAYVDLNPVRAGAPQQTKWTTYGLHVGRPELSEIPASLWTPSDWYLGQGPALYEQWVRECCERDWKQDAVLEDSPIFSKSVRKSRIFVEKKRASLSL
jgi:putative transposase